MSPSLMLLTSINGNVFMISCITLADVDNKVEKIAPIFNLMDFNKSGALSQDEMVMIVCLCCSYSYAIIDHFVDVRWWIPGIHVGKTQGGG